MSKILEFVPRDTVDARQRLDDFITHCKDNLDVFPRAIFADSIWDVSDKVTFKSQTKIARISFANDETAGVRNHKDIVSICEPLCSFAKSYLAYDYAIKPIKAFGPRLSAFRILEIALIEMKGSADPVLIDVDVLDRASAIARKKLGVGAAYQAANRLQAIAGFLASKRMLALHISWVSPLKKPQGNDRIGNEADQRRAKMLPGESVFDALPKAFRLANDPRTIAVTSVAALLLCAPSRISEVLALPVDCEVEERRSDGSMAFGLRWRPAKGARQMVKWIVPNMVPIAKESIARLRQLSEAPRAVAKWYDANPGKLYLPDALEHLRNRTRLSSKDLCEILKGVGADDQVPPRIRAQLKPVVDQKTRHNWFDFSKVEALLCSMHPKQFPNVPNENLRYSELLTLSFVNQYHKNKGVIVSIVEPLKLGVISDGLTPHSSKRSIFDDLGLIGDDGQRIGVRTHQFRHWLNTLAQSNGMSQVDIAKWSGRLDINQNEVYDHSISTDEVLKKLRTVVATGDVIYGPLASSRAIKLPISRDEYAQLKIPSVCETDIGYCTHDYIRSPCELHADCINCSELVCIVGDSEKTDMLRRKRDEVASRLSATSAIHGRAVSHLSKTHERLSAMFELLNDDTVVKGAFVQLTVDNASRAQMAIETRARELGEREVDMKALAIAKKIARR